MPAPVSRDVNVPGRDSRRSHKEFIRAPLWSLAQLKDANNQYIAAKAKEDLNKARSK
jgi:hypothetical protein